MKNELNPKHLPHTLAPQDPATPTDAAAFSAWLQEPRFRHVVLKHCVTADGDRHMDVRGTIYTPEVADRYAAEFVADEARRLAIRSTAEAAGFRLTRSKHSGCVVYVRGDSEIGSANEVLSPVPGGWTVNQGGRVIATAKTVEATLSNLAIA